MLAGRASDGRRKPSLARPANSDRTGCSSAWLERVVWDHEVAGSNPVTPIFRGAGMGCIREHIKVNGKKFWTLFDSGARNTYIVPAVAAQLVTFKLPKTFRSALGGGIKK